MTPSLGYRGSTTLFDLLALPEDNSTSINSYRAKTLYPEMLIELSPGTEAGDKEHDAPIAISNLRGVHSAKARYLERRRALL